jgi:prepilin-type N-terminal cleavage/methylation domain-containing protein
MAPDRSPARRRAGFTILELLVATSIIATLTTLLMAGIGTVRGAADAVECSGNLRQISTAFQSYLTFT